MFSNFFLDKFATFYCFYRLLQTSLNICLYLSSYIQLSMVDPKVLQEREYRKERIKEEIAKYATMPLNKKTFASLMRLQGLEELIYSTKLAKSAMSRPKYIHCSDFKSHHATQNRHTYRKAMITYISQWIEIEENPSIYSAPFLETLADICQRKTLKK